MLRTQRFRSATVLRCSICEYFPEEIGYACVNTYKIIAPYITTNMHLTIVEIFRGEVCKRYLPIVGISTFTFEHE
jgi:hypothetical protein